MPTRPSVTRLLSALAALVALGAAAPAAASAAPTGRLLVSYAPSGATRARAAAAELRSVAGAASVQTASAAIGLAVVRPRAGFALAPLAAELRRRPGVRSVQAEQRMSLRGVPSDPALNQLETAGGVPAGTLLQWPLLREGLLSAWGVSNGDRSLVAVIDTGADATHPDLAGRIVAAVDHESPATDPRTDTYGHGTWTASLACGTANNGTGIAGAGYACPLLIEKSDLSDSSIAESIVDATNRGAKVISMSFGADPGTPHVQAITDALDYAYRHDVVLVAAAADDAVTDQGQPASDLQPTGTGSRLASGIGLSVTSADFSGGRSSFAGYGSQISLAAYGSFADNFGPPGLIGAFPHNHTDLESFQAGFPPSYPCGCRTSINGDNRYAYLEGTSMSTPQVAGVAALLRTLNPALSAHQLITLIEHYASRSGGYSSGIGWGILDAAAAASAARRIDETAPRVSLSVSRSHASALLSFVARDPRSGKLIPSGIASVQISSSRAGSAARLIATAGARGTRAIALRHGVRYRFYAVAVDRAGNRSARGSGVAITG